MRPLSPHPSLPSNVTATRTTNQPGDCQTGTDQPLLFYWQYDEPQRSEFRARAVVDEGYLARDLNHGARMLSARFDDTELPDLTELPATDIDPELYSDAIADILQVAAWRGIDMHDLVERAISTAVAVFDYSASAARSRPE